MCWTRTRSTVFILNEWGGNKLVTEIDGRVGGDQSGQNLGHDELDGQRRRRGAFTIVATNAFDRSSPFVSRVTLSKGSEISSASRFELLAQGAFSATQRSDHRQQTPQW